VKSRSTPLFVALIAVLVYLGAISVTSASGICSPTETAGEGDRETGCVGNAALLNFIAWSQATQVDDVFHLYCAEDVLAVGKDKYSEQFCVTASTPVDTGRFALIRFGRTPSANPLEHETIPISYEGTAGKGILETEKGSKVECGKAVITGEISTPETGKLKILLRECVSLGAKCTTLGAGTGEIETKGTTSLVFDSLSPLGVAELYTLEEASFECVLVKVKVKGTLLILIAEFGKVVTEFEFLLKETKGSPSDKKYWEESKEKTPSLLASFNGGAFEAAGAELKEGKVKLPAGKMITIEG
jgi:hypothetical protein